MTVRTRLYRWWWRTPLARALWRELDDAHTGLRDALAAYDQKTDEAERHQRNLLYSWELLEQRDREYANLAQRCARAQEEVDFWRRFYNKTMPSMDAS